MARGARVEYPVGEGRDLRGCGNERRRALSTGIPSRRIPSRLGLVAAALAVPAVIVALPLAGHGGRSADTLRPIVRARPPASPVRSVTVEMRARESVAGALARGGLDAAQAERAAAALGEDFDIVNPHPGLALDLTLSATPPDGRPRLIRLAVTIGDERRLTEWRDKNGAFEVRNAQTAIVSVPSRIAGTVDGSLYLSLVDAGVDPPAAAKVVSLFGRRLDLSRDVESGDRFALVFEQPRRPDGTVVADKSLLYAEVVARTGPSRLYHFQPDGGGPADYLDGEAGPSRALLLRTPVDGARITSSFGPRLHPILGFTRMHQGVDFGAALGAPVLAAGDGVVEEARWSGGYGRWLKLRHAQGLETGYAHLSAWAAGIAPGARVRQGEVVGFVGETGLATGPHLHYEVFAGGRRIDPRLAARDERPDPLRQAAFRADKARIDAVVAAAG